MQNKKIQHLNLGEVNCDFSYMIRRLNEHTVNRYVQNMEAGAIFPPLLLTSSNKIVCGFHRYEAYIKIYGLEYKIPVILKNYKDEKEIFLDAISDNVKNGLPLTKFEIRQAIYKSKKYQMSQKELAELLNVKPENIQKWGDEIVIVKNNKTSEKKPIKGKSGVYVFKDNEITDTIYQDIEKKGSGWNLSFHINQIIKNIEWQSFELNNNNINLLKKLNKIITSLLKEVKNEK